METHLAPPKGSIRIVGPIAGALLVLTAFVLLDLYNYQLFHLFAVGFSIDLAIDGLLPKPYDLPALKGMLAKVAGVRVKA